MPNIADGLRETIEHRMRFPGNSHFTIFAEEHDREREIKRRHEEKRWALQKAEKELPTIVGWIIFSKNKPYPNANIDTAAKLGNKLKKIIHWSNEELVDSCVQKLIKRGSQNLIPWEKPFPYVAAILYRSILPEIADEAGVSLEGTKSDEWKTTVSRNQNIGSPPEAGLDI